MTVLLVDGNNLAIRSHMAPKHMNVGDEETGTLVLFVNTLARYVRLERPDQGLVAWDGGGSAFRMRIYPQYKAARKQKFEDKPQAPFAMIQKFLYLAGWPQQCLPGYEGDDIIGASWRACSARRRIRILSSDKDLFQLVQGATEQFRLIGNSERPDRWDRNRIITELGYKPEHAVLVMALTGDKIDGIPGLVGYGPKTAVKKLREYDWDILALINTLPEDQQNQVLLNLALMDLQVVPLELDEPPELHLVTPESGRWQELANFCDNYQLKQIKSKLETNTLWS